MPAPGTVALVTMLNAYRAIQYLNSIPGITEQLAAMPTPYLDALTDMIEAGHRLVIGADSSEFWLESPQGVRHQSL